MDDRRTEGHDHTPFGGSFLDAFRSPPYPFPDIPPYNVKTPHFHGGRADEGNTTGDMITLPRKSYPTTGWAKLVSYEG